MSPANINAPGQIVIAGAAEAVERAGDRAKALGARRVRPLPVSAPFHCGLMQPAQDRLEGDLRALVVSDPAIPVVANLDAEPKRDAAAAISALVDQVTAPVRWEQVVRRLASEGVDTYVEVGPGTVLSGLIRRIDRNARLLVGRGPRGRRSGGGRPGGGTGSGMSGTLRGSRCHRDRRLARHRPGGGAAGSRRRGPRWWRRPAATTQRGWPKRSARAGDGPSGSASTSPTRSASMPWSGSRSPSTVGSTCWSTMPASPGISSPLRMSSADWDAVVATNLTAAFTCARAVLRPMIRQRGGRIINVGSVVGRMGNAGQANYAASKAGLEGFSKALAREVASRGITVNVVAPGMIDTDMTAGLNESAQAAMLAQIPMGRLGTTEDVAGAICFLASDEAAYVTGHVLAVNGGMYM